ncbi:MAG: HAD family hydrolase [Bryobacteraceae bacterium]
MGKLSVIEIICSKASAAKARIAIFDFDGTLSLIRSGWMDVMLPLCVEQLVATSSGEPVAQLRGVAEEFIWQLTGKETIYQMMALADAVRERGGTPLEPITYKRMYLERLMQKISGRLESLREKQVETERYMVPGSRQLLESLVARGLCLYLASGTDDLNVKEEANLLHLSQYFEGRIYGAQDDLRSFSKALLVQQILSKADTYAEELVVFGDGYVEVEEVKKMGGTAIGVATAEPDCLHTDEWKRERLIKAGADFIIPNYLELDNLLGTAFGT